MSFDYDKLKKKHDSGEQWTSYSDLFMVLSVVFLLLYVVASVRSGTHSIQQQFVNKELVQKAQNLETQINAYNNLKDDYLDKEASDKEQEMYKQLMGKLVLLEEENSREASELRAKALENEKKEAALNEYQQMIRNVINANVLSKSKLKRRNRAIATQRDTIAMQVGTIEEKENDIIAKDLTISSKNKRIEEIKSEIKKLDREVESKKGIIAEKNTIISSKLEVLTQKQGEIKKLRNDIKGKELLISKNNNKIKRISTGLEKEINKLRRLRKNHKLSKKLYNIEIKRIQAKSKRRISRLVKTNNSIENKLALVSNKVTSVKSELDLANKAIDEQKNLKTKLARELSTIQSQVEQTKKSYEESSNALKGKISSLEQQKLKLSIQQKKLVDVNSQLSKVNTKLALDKNKLSLTQQQLKKQREKLVTEQLRLKNDNNKLSTELVNAQKVINAKRKIAKRIKSNFNKAGIKASVDPKSGEVILSFGDSFFGNGESKLKPKMRSMLNKFMPIYADSIFSDPKIAKKIKSVDIVGFASPTYGGFYVNPRSLEAKDRKAIQYNTNLSINRAKSVFNHIIDTNKLKFTQQKLITPLLKVSGRSYFSGSQERAPASRMTREEFCVKYDCHKEQRVIIKFELDN